MHLSDLEVCISRMSVSLRIQNDRSLEKWDKTCHIVKISQGKLITGKIRIQRSDEKIVTENQRKFVYAKIRNVNVKNRNVYVKMQVDTGCDVKIITEDMERKLEIYIERMFENCMQCVGQNIIFYW